MDRLKRLVKSAPVLRAAVRAAARRWNAATFPGSGDYWVKRYRSGGGSGDGSHGQLARFKAEVVNELIAREGINSVIEFGCGDGSQLALADYPEYRGFDVSPVAVHMCQELFRADGSKSFALMDEYEGETADLTLSLDVIYHLVEDDVFDEYMSRLFAASRRYVVIYSSDTDKNEKRQPPHVKHRRFTDWVGERAPEWRLQSHIPNRFPYSGDSRLGSFADFYVYERA